MSVELSLCMIVRNEAACLDACLSSVKDAVDEIVIVDTGSTDDTREIAARYTDRVYDHVWTDDFAAARNASMAYATRPYVLWLDADDVLDPRQAEKLAALREELDGSVDAVMLPYHYSFSAEGTAELVFDRERIVRRAAGFTFSGRVHEAMAVGGRVIRRDVVIRHTGRHGAHSNARNLRIYEQWEKSGEPMAARDVYYYAREQRSAGDYAGALALFRRFLSMDGWTENRLDAQIGCGACLEALGRRAEAKDAYLDALAFGAPRAEALCALGALTMADDLQEAAFWYRAALLCTPPLDTGAFVWPDAYGYVPLMQLCVICDAMGSPAAASQMNERALLLRPSDSAALRNRAYFREKLKK